MSPALVVTSKLGHFVGGRSTELRKGDKLYTAEQLGIAERAVIIPRPLAMKLWALLAQELAPCADPACRIQENPEAAIAELLAAFSVALDGGAST